MRKNKAKEGIWNFPEADWWDHNKTKVEELMLNAIKAGKLQRGTALKLAGKTSAS